MATIYEKLKAYSDSDYYGFHMPGHKRQSMGNWTGEAIDITEITGFDNLHHAEGILQEAQCRAAETFGADETFFLINGSTAGLLSAICGTVRRGGRLLMARNCHKAVYHAVYLMELKTAYLYPEQTEAYSWWSYRFKARERNAGWRIDYFLVSEGMKDRIEDSKILSDQFGSDHCPVELILK